ncbi:hypothetical protein [Sediminibacillus massiliensis]|uniref:hypothetical protein n=1 Tax=Sediminibacillus massiliensis TaxID=1926277 RepID=UPI0009886997|nr:hypothetical protein [Sediminibacillus massiliensis]
MAEKLIINGVRLEPYSLHENHAQSQITFHAKLTKEEYHQLTDLRLNIAKSKGYFDVILNSFIKVMRFGKIVYSEHDDYVKVRATLIEQDYTGQRNAIPATENLRQSVSELELTNKKLILLLQEKGLLTDEELIAVHTHSKEEILANGFPFYQVSDIDYYSDETNNTYSMLNGH